MIKSAWMARLFTTRGQAAGDLVGQCACVVAEHGVGPAGEFQVALAGGLITGHAGHRVAEGDALVEGGEGAELDPPCAGVGPPTSRDSVDPD